MTKKARSMLFKVGLGVALFIGLSLAVYAQAGLKRENLDWAIIKRLTVNGVSDINGNVDITGDVTLTGNLTGRALHVRYQDVAAAPAVRAQATVVATMQAVSSNILGIETPRNLKITYTTATTATAGSITVAGVDARGVSTTELIAVAAVSGTQTLTGAVPWVSVTSLTLPERSENVTLTVVGGQKFGLPIVLQASSELYHLTVNATPQAGPTVDATYGTFDPVSTPAANVDYNVWVTQ